LQNDLTNINSFTEVYAAREKVGVYIPKDRYQAEENERNVLLTRSLKSISIVAGTFLFHSRKSKEFFTIL
jgi:hypothetical protein